MNTPLFDSDIICVRCGYWYTPEAFIDNEHVCAGCRRADERKKPTKAMHREIATSIRNLLVYYQMTEDTEEIIYFIRGESTRLIKIGFTTTSPTARMRDLQVGSPDILSLVGYISGSYAFEQELHVLLRPYNSHGEWFNLPVTILGAFSKYMRHKLI